MSISACRHRPSQGAKVLEMKWPWSERAREQIRSRERIGLGAKRLGTKCITICQTKLNTLDNTDDVCTFVSANIILELELDALANPSHPIDDIGEES